MKRKCKKVDICDVGLITTAVYQCLYPCRKRRRYDTVAMFSKYLPECSRRQVNYILRNRTDEYDSVCKRIAKDLRKELRNQKLKLSSPKHVQRIDKGSGKVRHISVLNIWQLLLDHIAVLALSDLSRRIGITQVSSIKGRGTAYGLRFLKRWLKAPKKKLFAVKLDVKNFYGSVDRGLLMNWLHKRIKNPKLLWLIGTLIYSIPEGIAIGSYLSQTLANIYLSDLYHYAKEECYYVRNTKKKGVKRIPIIKYVLFYMDDMLFIGTNARKMKSIIKHIIQRAKDILGLTIKSNWCIRRITKRHPVDMMGFRVAPGGKVTLRKHIFKHARRIFIRANNSYITLRQAQRLISYWGYLMQASTYAVQLKWNAIRYVYRAKAIISKYAHATR